MATIKIKKFDVYFDICFEHQPSQEWGLEQEPLDEDVIIEEVLLKDNNITDILKDSFIEELETDILNKIKSQ